MSYDRLRSLGLPALQVISLYFFSFFGIILWDEYPTAQECFEEKEYFEVKFRHLNEERQFFPECLELGKTTKEFMELHGVTRSYMELRPYQDR